MRPYAGIPDAQRPGLLVEENAALLRRYAYIEQRLLLLQAGHFPGTAIWECKHALARHAWEDAQHADALRRRIVTLRTSPRLLDECPDPALEALMDEAERAEDEVELLAGVHGVIKPALLAAYRWHLETTNPVADFPTVRELEIIVREEAGQLAWAAEALTELAGPAAAEAAAAAAAGVPTFTATNVAPGTPQRDPTDPLPGWAQGGPPIGAPRTPEPGAPERALAWQAHLRTLLSAAGGITGREERGVPEPPRSGRRFRISRHPRRDPRFRIHFQFHEPGDPPPQDVPEKLIFMMRGRLNELAATENPASALFELAQGPDPAPWEALWELARHMWDEARHSMLGQAVLESLGHDIRTWPLRIGPGYSYLSVPALERYAHLGLNVEQGMMRYPPGKREEFEWCRDVARNPLAAMYQDYDWADEVYHTQIARRWVARLLAGPDGTPADFERLRAFAAEAGRRIGANTRAIAEAWHAARAQGRTLGEGDPLPGEAGDDGQGPVPSEYEAPELTLTKEQVEEDLRRQE
jgi:bacterioferritin (cytochrome b1)